MIFLDTNIFYNYLFETELTENAEKILSLGEDFVTSFTVINETIYVIIRKLAERKYNIKSYHDFRKFISEKGYVPFKEDLSKFFNLLEDLGVIVLEDYQNMDEWLETMNKYKLLPTDAQIVLTCKYYGIKKIATFDEDFKRINFLEVIEL